MHPVGAKVAKALAQLAPGRHDAAAVEIGHRKGPDQALGQAAVLVLIVQHHLVLGADRAAQSGLPGLGWGAGLHVGDHQAAGIDCDAQLQRQGAADAVHRGAGGSGQLRVGLQAGPARAQQQGFELIGIEHQGRQQKARPHLKANAWIALDGRALLTQAGDIAVDGAQAHLQGLGQRRAGLGLAGAAQQIEQAEQTGRTGHRASIAGLPGLP